MEGFLNVSMEMNTGSATRMQFDFITLYHISRYWLPHQETNGGVCVWWGRGNGLKHLLGLGLRSCRKAGFSQRRISVLSHPPQWGCLYCVTPPTALLGSSLSITKSFWFKTFFSCISNSRNWQHLTPQGLILSSTHCVVLVTHNKVPRLPRLQEKAVCLERQDDLRWMFGKKPWRVSPTARNTTSPLAYILVPRRAVTAHSQLLLDRSC
jgi:hypothetical protein